MSISEVMNQGMAGQYGRENEMDLRSRNKDRNGAII